jgi:DNA primase large subunit
MKPILDKYMPLSSSSSNSPSLQQERQKDHYSHFILRLAFASTEDLRRRFARVETMLFRLRFQADDVRERVAFVETLSLDWEVVSEEEKRELGEELKAAGGGYPKRIEDENYFKVDWERVPELVDSRRVFLRGGRAYVPGREQSSMVVAEFTVRLEKALEVCPSFVDLLGRMWLISIDDFSRFTSSRRRRPSDTDPHPPLQQLHHPRRLLQHNNSTASRRRDHSTKHRYSILLVPTLHAEPAPKPSQGRTSQALWTSSIHTFPERYRLEPRRVLTVLETRVQ